MNNSTRLQLIATAFDRLPSGRVAMRTNESGEAQGWSSSGGRRGEGTHYVVFWIGGDE